MMETTITPGSITFTFDRDQLQDVAWSFEVSHRGGEREGQFADALHDLVRTAINDYLTSTTPDELEARLAPPTSKGGAL